MLLALTPKEAEVLKRAAERWGTEDEHNMACEELSETIQALCHQRRGRVPTQKVIDEFGDAITCVMQRLVTLEGGNVNIRVEQAVRRSIARLEEKLERNDFNYRGEG